MKTEKYFERQPNNTNKVISVSMQRLTLYNIYWLLTGKTILFLSRYLELNETAILLKIRQDVPAQYTKNQPTTKSLDIIYKDQRQKCKKLL